MKELISSLFLRTRPSKSTTLKPMRQFWSMQESIPWALMTSFSQKINMKSLLAQVIEQSKSGKLTLRLKLLRR